MADREPSKTQKNFLPLTVDGGENEMTTMNEKKSIGGKSALGAEQKKSKEKTKNNGEKTVNNKSKNFYKQTNEH